jgi:hypothetical protein
LTLKIILNIPLGSGRAGSPVRAAQDARPNAHHSLSEGN